ncbi:hypothetical protein FGCSD_0107 [Streptococcus dysgalactiae]|nr:hypothetical protein FGCSD_0107 [Streptococcus dysgalactiae]
MKELIELVKNYLNKSRIDFKYILFILLSKSMQKLGIQKIISIKLLILKIQ